MANQKTPSAFIMLALCGLAGTLMLASPATAIERVQTKSATCASVQTKLIQNGAAILRYPSARTGNMLFDKYVGDSRQCQSNEIGKWASVPTRDTNSCRVIACSNASMEDPLFTGFGKPWLRLRVGG